MYVRLGIFLNIMDMTQQQLMLPMLQSSQMTMGFLMGVCMMASEVNMHWCRQNLLEPLNRKRYNMEYRLYVQMHRNFRLFEEDDDACIYNLRMDMKCFEKLCEVLEVTAGLYNNRHVTVKEQVAIFLSILAHNKKSRIVHFDFIRSGETISKYFHLVLKGVLGLHKRLLVVSEPVNEHNAPTRWQPFQVSDSCLCYAPITSNECTVYECDVVSF